MYQRVLNRQFIISATDRFCSLIPWHRNTQIQRIFINKRPSLGGPGQFVNKLSGEIEHQGIGVTYRKLRSSQMVLMISSSWGDWFHYLCKRWSLRSLLRVDGFYLPIYFDNRPQLPGFKDRRLTPEKMKFNYRLQHDLLMADHVIYQSAFSKEMCDRYLYKRQDNFSIVFNGVDLDSFRPCPKRLGHHKLLVLGSIRDEYMLGTVLPTFEHLSHEYDLELLIIGPLDSINRQLLARFQQQAPALYRRILYVGPVANEDLPRYLSEADVLLHPRLGDSCPNTVVEAMACGLPVVCGSWGGAAELIGEGGLVISTGPWEYGESFVQGMVDCTAKIIDDLDRFQEKARVQAEANFDIRRVTRSYLNALGVM